MSDPDEPLEAYFRTVEDVDAAAASDVVLGLLEQGAPPDEITTRVLAPAQVRVGELWEAGRWSVADEHAASAVAETALAALTAAAGSRARSGRHVMVACAEGEWHSLPARMAAGIAGSSEQRVTVLGPSLPAEHLGRRLEVGDVDLLALSCTLPTNLIGAARCIAAAHGARVPVVVGGRAFGSTSRRAEAVGADAWAADAQALLGPTPELAGRSSDIPLESLLLDAVSELTLSTAYDRLAAAYPRLTSMTPIQQTRTREDLQWMARFTAATVLTADVTILDEFLLWLARLLRGRVPVEVLVTSARLLATTVEAQAPVGSQLLREAAERLEEPAA